MASIAFAYGCVDSQPPQRNVPIVVRAVTITPTEATVQPGGRFRFTARVEGDGFPSQDILWSAQSLRTEDYAYAGSVGLDGTYAAPSYAPPRPVQVRIVAASKIDSSISASARVTIPSPSIAVTPQQAEVFVGDSLQLQAIVNGTVDPTLYWTAYLGTVESTGLYHAPRTVAPDQPETVTVSCFELGLRASVNIVLRYRPPEITSTSGPAGPYETLRIKGRGFQQAQSGASVFFPSSGPEMLEETGSVLSDGEISVVVPPASASGQIRVAIPPVAKSGKVYSGPLQFERAPRLRLHAERKDLSAGESMRVSVAITGVSGPITLAFDADAGSFDGDVYTAPAQVDSTTFVNIRSCVPGTKNCSGVTLALHPFRIEPDPAIVPAGGSLQLVLRKGDGIVQGTFAGVKGNGVVTADGMYTAPSSLVDAGEQLVSATVGAHTETVQVAVEGLVPGRVTSLTDYLDRRPSAENPIWGTAVEELAVGEGHAFALGRPAATSFIDSVFNPTLFFIDVYDLSDPLRPRWIGAVESATRPTRMFVSHGRLYAFSDDEPIAHRGRSVAVYDLSSPTPALVRRAVPPYVFSSILSFLEPPAIDDESLYVFGLTRQDRQVPLDIYRLADGPLENPRHVSIPYPPSAWTIEYLTARNGFAYMTFMDSEPLASLPKVAAWDLSTDPATLVGVVDATLGIVLGSPIGFAGRYLVAGGCLFDTEAPSLVRASCPLEGGGVIASDRGRVLADSTELLDLSDPSNPRKAGRVGVDSVGPGSSWAGLVYLPEDLTGIGIYDISLDGGAIDSGSLQFTAPYVFPDARLGAISGGMVYAAGEAYDDLNLTGWYFLGAWDLGASPAAFVGQQMIAAPATAMAASGNLLLVGRIDALEVRSLSDPRAPSLLSELPAAVTAIASTASVAWMGTADGRLLAVDLADPAAPVVRSELQLRAPATAIKPWEPARLLVTEASADGLSGDLEVIDVSVSSAPFIHGSLGLGIPCAGVDLFGSTAALATAAGFATADLADQAHPVLLDIERMDLSRYGEPYQQDGARFVGVHGGIAWVSGQGLSGVFGFDVRAPRRPRLVMRHGSGRTNALLFSGNRAVALGFVPLEFDVSQPRNLILELRPPAELQPLAPIPTAGPAIARFRGARRTP